MMALKPGHPVMLANLLNGFVDTTALPEISVTGLALDSRQVEQGMLFIAVQGAEVDGASFIGQAINRGAVAVLIEKDAQSAAELIKNSFKVPIIAVEKLSEYISDIAGQYYGNPSSELAVTAITGTNGKTTCSRLLAELLQLMGKTAGFVGTMGYALAKEQRAIKETGLTTPDAITAQEILAELKEKGASHIAMEVSSHSLVQRRVAGLHINTAVFTNLSRDHLDYHGDLKSYAAAKSRLFAMQGLENAVINVDDSIGRLILANLREDIKGIGYSLDSCEADVYCKTIGLSPEGVRAQVVTPWGEGEIRSSLLGKFNLSNLLAVLTATCAQGFSLSQVLEVLPQLGSVEGRMELVDVQARPHVVIDYAHTPDALEKVLEALRFHCQGALWCLFGCGGDRDRGKRPLMGEVASRLADLLVITSDNPRTESPQQIIDDILEGVNRTNRLIVESDRSHAIKQAVMNARDDDIVLIAGKGHETYQQIGVERFPFSDQAEARLALRARGSAQ